VWRCQSIRDNGAVVSTPIRRLVQRVAERPHLFWAETLNGYRSAGCTYLRHGGIVERIRRIGLPRVEMVRQARIFSLGTESRA
jgi:hypothetical protein